MTTFEGRTILRRYKDMYSRTDGAKRLTYARELAFSILNTDLRDTQG